MSRSYFITPQFSVAFNPKVGTSTLSRAIIKAFYPEQEFLIQNAAYPEGKYPDNTMVQFLCPTESLPTKPLVLIVRGPVDRFRSAMAQLNLTDVEQALSSLEDGTLIQFAKRPRSLRADAHFKPQHELAVGPTKVFRFEDIDAAALYIGLQLPLPVINEAKRIKPDLTESQRDRVLEYYAIDQYLYSVTPPEGFTYDL